MNDVDQGQLSDALARMNEALRILDETGAAGDIGGHLDLAIARLEQRLGLKKPAPHALKDDLSPTVKDVPPDAGGIGDTACTWDITSV